jgi:hypothetical protein
MSIEAWIGIAAIVAGVLSQFGSALWQIKAARVAESSTKQSKQKSSQSHVGNRRSYWWKRRVVIFVVNTIAVYFLVEQMRNPNALTRTSALIIAVAVGVICICFMLPFFIGIYEYIDVTLENRDA